MIGLVHCIVYMFNKQAVYVIKILDGRVICRLVYSDFKQNKNADWIRVSVNIRNDCIDLQQLGVAVSSLL